MATRTMNERSQSNSTRAIGTRGFRNKNPFNIRRSMSKWVGKVPQGTDPEFEQFSAFQFGVRAGLYLLTKYVRDYKLKSVEEIIHRYAPDGDGGNNEKAYCAALLQGAGFTNMARSDVERTKYWLYKMASGMCLVESRYYLSTYVFENAFKLLPENMRMFWFGHNQESQVREEVDGL